MDEIGFLEAAATGFSSQILKIIDGNYLVLGTIKPKDTPLLDEIRRHKAVSVFTITEENRDELKQKLISIFSEQINA